MPPAKKVERQNPVGLLLPDQPTDRLVDRDFRPLADAVRTFCVPDFAECHLEWIQPVSSLSYCATAMVEVDLASDKRFEYIPGMAEAILYLMKRANLDGGKDETDVIEGDDRWLEHWKYLQSVNNSLSITSARNPVLIGTDLLMERWVYWLQNAYYSQSGERASILGHPDNGYDRAGIDLIIYSADGVPIPVGAIDVKNSRRDADLLSEYLRWQHIREANFVSKGIDYNLPLFKLYVGGGFRGTGGFDKHQRTTAWRAAEVIMSDLRCCPLVLPDGDVLSAISGIFNRIGLDRNTNGGTISGSNPLDIYKRAFVTAIST